jgi:lipopolysaccharide assembly protein A
MKMQWILICALLFALITAVFAVINVEPVQVNFLFAQTNTPLILVILTSTLLGGLIVGMFGIIRQYKLQRRVRGLEKQLQEALAPAVVGQVQTEAGQAPESSSTSLH